MIFIQGNLKSIQNTELNDLQLDSTTIG